MSLKGRKAKQGRRKGAGGQSGKVYPASAHWDSESGECGDVERIALLSGSASWYGGMVLERRGDTLPKNARAHIVDAAGSIKWLTGTSTTKE